MWVEANEMKDTKFSHLWIFMNENNKRWFETLSNKMVCIFYSVDFPFAMHLYQNIRVIAKIYLC